MKSNFCKIIATIIFIFSFAISAFAQSSDTAVLLLQPLGARGVALGESYVAIADGSQSQYWNPAGVASFQRGLHVSFTHRPELLRNVLNYENGNIAYQINSHSTVAVNFSYVHFNHPDFVLSESESYAIGISYAVNLHKNFSAGITLKRISNRVDEFSDNSYAIDLGLLHRIKNVLNTRISKSQFNLGASLSNLGQKTGFFEGQRDSLPRFLRVGFSYEVKSINNWTFTEIPYFATLISFEYQNLLNEDENENIWEWGGGIELRFLEIASFRLGYHERHPKTNQTVIGKTLETGTSYGFGFKVPINRILKTAAPFIVEFDFASAPQGGWVERYEMYTFRVKLEI